MCLENKQPSWPLLWWQVLSWLTRTGEDSLQRHANMACTLPAIRQQELEFDKFYFVSMVRAHGCVLAVVVVVVLASV